MYILYTFLTFKNFIFRQVLKKKSNLYAVQLTKSNKMEKNKRLKGISDQSLYQSLYEIIRNVSIESLN